MADILVVGAGGLGVASAFELVRRGHHVRLLDPGPLPHPEAASTDRSKVVRADYGTDPFYTELALQAMSGWAELNRRWGRLVYHPCGVMVLSSEPLCEGSFEGDSHAFLSSLGEELQRIDSGFLQERGALWSSAMFSDGYFNPRGGWVESSAAVAALIEESQTRFSPRLELLEGVHAKRVLRSNGVATGVDTSMGVLSAEAVVVAAGKWTPLLVPELRQQLQPTAHPVFYFQPKRPELFQPPAFSVWTADIAQRGWYGFPAGPDGIVKVARHGAGLPLEPHVSPPPVATEQVEACREFLSCAIPDLADARLVGTRACVYCDSLDGDPILAPVEDCSGLFVVSGGSGHAFKFLPVLGGIAADIVEGKSNRFNLRFGWRLGARSNKEAARCSS